MLGWLVMMAMLAVPVSIFAYVAWLDRNEPSGPSWVERQYEKQREQEELKEFRRREHDGTR